jgi:hypothetical protein
MIESEARQEMPEVKADQDLDGGQEKAGEKIFCKGMDKKTYWRWYYQKNKEKHTKLKKVWREKNKEKAARDYKAWREKNKEKASRDFKVWYHKNKVEHHKYCKAYRDRNIERHAEVNKAWYERNVEKTAQVNKLYRERNKEKIHQDKRIWRHKNIERVREQDRNRWRKQKEKERSLKVLASHSSDRNPPAVVTDPHPSRTNPCDPTSLTQRSYLRPKKNRANTIPQYEEGSLDSKNPKNSREHQP